jgi:hypothetical protein
MIAYKVKVAKPDPLHYRDGLKYQLTHNYLAQMPFNPPEQINSQWIAFSSTGQLFIRAGWAWDGASGPSIDSASAIRPSAEHDALYWLMRNGYLDPEIYREPADLRLYEMLRVDGMLDLRAWAWYKAVRTFAERAATMQEPPELVAGG